MNATLTARSLMMISRREGADLIARQTGGFLIRNSNDFGLKKVADDQKGYYLLGYRPADETFNRMFHRIKVKVKRGGLEVRTRDGFYGISEESNETRELTAADQLKKALISPFAANEIAIQLTTMFTNFNNGSLLRSLVYIKAEDLTFDDEPEGRHVAKFDLGIILFGENGRVRDQQSREVTLRLNDRDYQSAIRNGVVYTLDTPMRQPGAFQFRIAMRDHNSARMGSAGQFIQIPNLANGRLALSGLVMLKDVPDKSGNDNVQPSDTEDAISTGPAVRRFRPGDKIIFAYSVYNAQPDASTRLPQLTMQTRIFRDGKAVLTGDQIPIEIAPQSDVKRIPSIGRLQIGPELPPGHYVLQIIVTDRLAKEKEQIASQWIDFEVVN
jgi:hypothetical protein